MPLKSVWLSHKKIQFSKITKILHAHTQTLFGKFLLMMGHFDSVQSVMVFYWLFHKAVLQKDTIDANLAHIGVNLPENIARNGNVVYLPTFSFSTFFKRTWDFVLLWLGFPKINVPVISEDFLLPKCSKSEMLLKVSEDLLTIFEHFRRYNLLKKVMFLVCIVRHFEHKVNIKSLFWNIC